MWSCDGCERERNIILRLEMRDEMSAVQAAHRMGEEVHTPRGSLVSQELVKILCARRNRAGAA